MSEARKPLAVEAAGAQYTLPLYLGSPGQVGAMLRSTSAGAVRLAPVGRWRVCPCTWTHLGCESSALIQRDWGLAAGFGFCSLCFGQARAHLHCVGPLVLACRV